MTERLIRLWRWVGAHRLLAGWAVGALGIALFSGGAALGATSEQAVPLGLRLSGVRARNVPTVVEAVVVGRQGANVLARTRDGDLLVIRTTDATRYRIRNRKADASAVRRGARVIVVGRPLGEGIIRARAISVRGRVPLAGASNEQRAASSEQRAASNEQRAAGSGQRVTGRRYGRVG
jgi:hypothetical protein